MCIRDRDVGDRRAGHAGNAQFLQLVHRSSQAEYDDDGPDDDADRHAQDIEQVNENAREQNAAHDRPDYEKASLRFVGFRRFGAGSLHRVALSCRVCCLSLIHI